MQQPRLSEHPNLCFDFIALQDVRLVIHYSYASFATVLGPSRCIAKDEHPRTSLLPWQRQQRQGQVRVSSWCFLVKQLSERYGGVGVEYYPRILTMRQSSLVLRFVNNDFQENKEPTIGGASLSDKISVR